MRLPNGYGSVYRFREAVDRILDDGQHFLQHRRPSSKKNLKTFTSKY